MSFAAAAADIKKHFATLWANLTPVAYDDVPFTIPNNLTWGRLNVSHVLGYQATVGAPGSNYFRRKGLVTLQIFQKEKGAQKDGLAKADAAVSVFQGKHTDGNIKFENVRMNEIGPDGNGWYQVNVKADFLYDIIA